MEKQPESRPADPVAQHERALAELRRVHGGAVRHAGEHAEAVVRLAEAEAEAADRAADAMIEGGKAAGPDKTVESLRRALSDSAALGQALARRHASEAAIEAAARAERRKVELSASRSRSRTIEAKIADLERQIAAQRQALEDERGAGAVIEREIEAAKAAQGQRVLVYVGSPADLRARLADPTFIVDYFAAGEQLDRWDKPIMMESERDGRMLAVFVEWAAFAVDAATGELLESVIIRAKSVDGGYTPGFLRGALGHSFNPKDLAQRHERLLAGAAPGAVPA